MTASKGFVPLPAPLEMAVLELVWSKFASRLNSSGGVTPQRSTETIHFPFHLPAQPVLAVIHHQHYPTACPILTGTGQAALLRGLCQRDGCFGDFSVTKAFE